MVKSLSLFLVLAFCVSALANIPPPPPKTLCYDLSRDGKAWSKTPETLCVTEETLVTTNGLTATITLKTGMPEINEKTVAVFNYGLLSRARCFDCNEDVFGVLNPENSLFNTLQISFEGKREFKAGYNGCVESGTLKIGETQFYYKADFTTPIPN